MRRIDFVVNFRTSSHIDDNRLNSERDYYMATDGRDFSNGKVYKYDGNLLESMVLTRILETDRIIVGKLRYGEGFVIELGGPFEKVGARDESIGGDDQELG